MTINLQRFCANALDPREHLHKPWRSGQWVYATNGHLAVRVSSAAQPDAAAATDKHPDTGSMFEKYMGRPRLEFLRMPAIPALAKCISCRGKGEVRCIKCPDCDEGEFRHGDHHYNCKNCEGSPAGAGWQWLDDYDEDQPHQVVRVCEDCDGMGYSKNVSGSTKLGDAHYSNIYLAMFAALPEVRVCPGEPSGDWGSRPVPAVFIFDGGHGLLMPMRGD